MNIRNFEIKKKSKRRPYLLFLIFYTLIIFSIEPLYREALFNYSIELVDKIEKSIKFRNYIAVVETISNFLGTYKIYVFLLIIIYNTANIYKTFIFLITYLLSTTISAILKEIYRSPLMYYDKYGYEMNLKPIICYAGWGNPSTYSVTATAVYLTLWKIIFDNARLRYKRNARIVFLVFFIFLILMINICKFLSKVHSINQIIFGNMIGFAIFYIVFYIFKVDLNNSKDMLRIIEIKLIYYIIMNIFCLFLYLFLFFVNNIEKETYNKYLYIIENVPCSYLPYSLRLSNESLIVFVSFFSNIGIIMGMKCEYKILFGGNETNWRHYNFAKELNEDDSLLSRISIARETQWNHTNLIITFLRLFIVGIITTIIVIPPYFIQFNSNIFLIIFVKIILTWNILTFSLFFLNKIILRKLGLTNNSIFALSNDNI